MKYYYLTNTTGKTFFNFIYSGGKFIRLKNTYREVESVLYTFDDAHFYSTLLNVKKYPTSWIMQKEFYKLYKTIKTKNNEQTKKRRSNKNSIPSTSCNG
jgi:hypothetical protein